MASPRARQLAAPPLAEVVVEIKWRINTPTGSNLLSGSPVDPGYPLSVGRLYDRLRNRFPSKEELPAAAIPDAITPHVVKQRFRAEGGWPCVQLGPGVATINDTSGYRWDTFRDTVRQVMPLLREAYEGSPLEPISALLRYINGIAFNTSEQDVLSVMRDQLHTRIEIPESIIGDKRRAGNPEGVLMRLSLPLQKPRGVASVQVGTGKREQDPALVWELALRSTDESAPSLDEAFDRWLDEAHDVLESWFFALIQGELEERFSSAG